jgi:Asp-tRNA(Asn)/Glu-tRNA(Gln) amidotransferase A subunit family amidase
VVGFKPTTGRWPRGGVAPISHTLDTTGLLARSVEAWSFGDGATATGPSASHAYAKPGTYEAVATVSDGAAQAQASSRITITGAATTATKAVTLTRAAAKKRRRLPAAVRALRRAGARGTRRPSARARPVS